MQWIKHSQCNGRLSWLAIIVLFGLNACTSRYYAAPVENRQQNGYSVPAPVVAKPANSATRAASASYQALDTQGRHQVKAGDTLYRIARHYQQSVRQLAAWNRLSPPYTVYPGQVLQVRPVVAAPVQTSPRTVPHTSSQRPTRQLAPRAMRPVPAQSHARTSVNCTPNGGLRHWRWPTQVHKISTTFTRSGRRGITIAGQTGQPVLAAHAGKVLYSGVGVNGYYGDLIIIQHHPAWLSVYAYNRTLRVRENDQVQAGQIIASMGKNSQGQTALHFEISCDGKTVDPLKFLPTF
ncbi:peptidoglycan DD-metalloendopeptidase family protein [Candidatus Venteria ishoeyi]|uniref:Murein hydrolase activator NlpD n=1 Tax=Candidatus Venteria ishoeyi TaxID=1899563 RepID=A0A1H6FE34_9GAMM|nr:peptidoglycan DD-metalloendopeptidase family protein [Candidatus Venteria ishoeyi]MDM8546257.1 peptidoglycan DD-metalloendopeptidase family protein [Candidatus Venteria ishoeyi]SEH07426.1 Murein hydrolase activator NlpD precursor [Candidatus Venteria ishoeyi]